MYRKFLIFCFLLLTVNSYCQNYILYGDKTFGTAYYNDVKPAIMRVGNYLLIAGQTNANLGQDKTEPKCDSLNQFDGDIWILKIDTAFNILWNRSIGGERGENCAHLLKNNSNGFFLSCESKSDSVCERTEHNRGASPQYDYWIFEGDSAGNRIRDKTFGGSLGDGSTQLIRLTSGNYIACGGSNSPISGDKSVAPYNTSGDYWAVKFDSTGTKIWDQIYGGTGYEYGDDAYDYLFNILADDHDNFLLAGTISGPASGNISDTSRGDMDFWIIKIDSSGNKIWDKRYGGIGEERCNHIIHTADNGYLVCGCTLSPQGLDVTDSPKGSGDCWVLKLDSLGNKQWDKRYGGINGSSGGTWMEPAPGGGYWISGYTGSDSSYDVTENQYGSNFDYWIFKIDSVGNKLWDKRFGGPHYNWGSSFVIMPDSSIFLMGYADTGTTSVKTDIGKGLYDYWLVHFKYTYTNTGIQKPANIPMQVTVAPNPTNGTLTLKSSTTCIALLTLTNTIGATIYQKRMVLQAKNKLDFSLLPKGMYFLRVEQPQGSAVCKFVKE